MGLVETEGLVLKNYSLSDADKITVFLTKDHGLVRGVAKGAKRLKSHFGSSLEPFSLVRLGYFQKDQIELVSIRNCDLIKSSFEQASDPLYLQKFAYMAELLCEFVPSGEPNERLFNMTRICLDMEVQNAESLDGVLLYFELWLLKLAGYLPQWDKCSACGRGMSEDESASVDSQFQLVCPHCKPLKGAWVMRADERLVYASAQKMGPQKFSEITEGKTEPVRNVSQIMRRIIAGILGKDWHEDRILSAIYR